VPLYKALYFIDVVILACYLEKVNPYLAISFNQLAKYCIFDPILTLYQENNATRLMKSALECECLRLPGAQQKRGGNATPPTRSRPQ